jgi:hypothetical protein
MNFWGAKFHKMTTMYIHVYCHKILRRIMIFFPKKVEEISMILIDFLIKGQYVPNILLFGKV